MIVQHIAATANIDRKLEMLTFYCKAKHFRPILLVLFGANNLHVHILTKNTQMTHFKKHYIKLLICNNCSTIVTNK